MAKKVIDRIFKTIMIVIDALFGGLFTIYSVVCLSRSSYDIEHDFPGVAMSIGIIILINLSNIIIRKWIKEYWRA